MTARSHTRSRRKAARRIRLRVLLAAAKRPPQKQKKRVGERDGEGRPKTADDLLAREKQEQ